MIPVKVHAHISAPRERVFELITDLATRVAWAGDWMDQPRLLSPRSSGTGAGVRFRQRAPLVKRWAETAIVEADPPRRLREEGRAGRLGRTRTEALWELSQGAGGVTRVDLTLSSEPAGLAERLRESLGLRGWTKRRARRALDRLRRILEEGGDQPLERITIAGYEDSKAPRFGRSPALRTPGEAG